ncbi:acyl-CoA dehydrogenase family protein [Botrimarina hoheduenensis]|uniref:Glutaryl-CoA dehydrogenase n=1 Tax=Botrimarina hoheduenensis TaxID=2528000 RepID=A0A5C5VV40_9BACT|nr:acyl-CoA dehydrogenase family protein [Botrimarina hoheduenensis]TWT42464.1 Glutaryl-CoA dehydrogenase [Botrimarina hoheduenensis]
MQDRIQAPDDVELRTLCDELARRAGELDRTGDWPAEQLRRCGEAGVFEWFLPIEYGGQGWDDVAITRGYLQLAQACLSTTFVITQRVGACKRIAGSTNEALKQALLPGLVSGKTFATVGISHLTTSRRHLATPVLSAEPTADGYTLNGYAPWVTGAQSADQVVVGAVLVENGRPTNAELLVVVDTLDPAVKAPDPFPMVALSASKTGALQLNGYQASRSQVIAGPVEKVLTQGSAGAAGGPQTSTLAVGAASASLDLLAREADRRPELHEAHAALSAEHSDLECDLIAAAKGEPACSSEQLRQRANSHVLRASQAALTATKGAGYLADAQAGRLCREALFFLVWSCPAPVQAASLCELAGLTD